MITFGGIVSELIYHKSPACILHVTLARKNQWCIYVVM